MVPSFSRWHAAILLVVPLCSPFCTTAASDPQVWSVNGHTYEAVSAPGISWASAKAACELRGGYLATITSRPERDLILSLAPNWWISRPNGCPGNYGSFYVGPWLGGRSNTPDPNNMTWITGESPASGYCSDYAGSPNAAVLGRLWAPDQGYDQIYVSLVSMSDPGIPGYIFESCNATVDTDNDGLRDCWEEPNPPFQLGESSGNGIPIAPAPSNASVPTAGFYRLPGSDRNHKDLFVEVDALPGRNPSATSLAAVRAAFANSPNGGITLHASLDETHGDVGPQNWNLWDDFDAYKNVSGPDNPPKGHFGTAAERINPNWTYIREAKLKAYRYCVFADRQSGSNSGSAGNAHDPLPTNDFVVTLGPWYYACGGPTVPSDDEMAGTFMHELGHALGLYHGGGDPQSAEEFNYKPNYPSVMNYLWMMRIREACYPQCGTPPQLVPNALKRYRDSWQLDYSRGTLPDLDESDLDEGNGIGGSNPVPALLSRYVPVGPPVPYPADVFSQIVPMGGPVNWNRAGSNRETGRQADINYVRDCQQASTGSLAQVPLKDFDDWANLKYAVPQMIPMGGDKRKGVQETEQELTLEMFESLSTMQLDCNGNELPDEQDILTGRSQDTNGDGVPDECDPIATPTLLALFRCVTTESGIELRWRMGPEVGASRVAVERSLSDGGPWISIQLEQRLDGAEVIALDAGTVAGTTYWYRLIVRWDTGDPMVFGPLSATRGVTLTEFALQPIAPNPTAGAARIVFEVPVPSRVRVSVADVLGREVAEVVSGEFGAGRWQATWSGSTPGGRVRAGVYFVRVETSRGTIVRNVAVLR